MPLFGCMYPASQAGIDSNDIFHFCTWPLNILKEHMPQPISPGWFLAPDKSMSAWVVKSALNMSTASSSSPST
eukprot:6187983-Pleurochrysis_carterae.AAC.1